MDYNQGLDISNQIQEDVWVDEINEFRLNGRLCEWITGFHPEQIPCQLDGGFLNGSYNIGQKIIFEDGTTWLLRFPRVKSICPKYADEKVVMEVEALSLIRERTSVPVPDVKAWGLAESNPLGLGPFILMDFIDGVCLNDVFTGGNSRLLKKEIPDSDLEIVYSQIANFMLQIFEINFDRIGSLPTARTGYSAPIRPLTWKIQEIAKTGGLNTFGDRTKGFSTTMAYFQYVIDQDWQQLRYQPNSITGELDAISKYASLSIVKSLIPRFVNAAYENGPFKLICDDFGPANMIVKSEKDLTIVGVVDLEWVYAGPAQLFGSAPWWLLHDRPVNEEWDFVDGNPPEATKRYINCLDIFKEALVKEEAKMPREQGTELSKLVEWSEASGAMWVHMLLSSGFFDSFSFPCMQLRQCVGARWWRERVNELEIRPEVEQFAAHKLQDLEEFDKSVDKIEELKDCVDRGEMTRDEFIVAIDELLVVR
ncbi:uncharacterized protein N7515_000457 [Penicillium bovifimosum]|uniref:Aminoglycoside phosphotransferase domain-containing protein n=1 Tax=Penicillium bovifimosum TaxID=126998 RepID=A0A9W9HFG3_9EURO|nr:uncharacterized protein N7515_000457 [Penicillium bovifimosum]KAJ5145893.1 hypothetical protein N7515_000457 [Penicillium bovifimosum]